MGWSRSCPTFAVSLNGRTVPQAEGVEERATRAARDALHMTRPQAHQNHSFFIKKKCSRSFSSDSCEKKTAEHPFRPSTLDGTQMTPFFVLIKY